MTPQILRLDGKRWLPVVAVLLLAPASASGQTAEGSFERTLEVTGNVDLDVRAGSGTISIRKGRGDAVVVRGRIRAGDSWQRRSAEDAAARVRYFEQNPPVEQHGSWIRIGILPDDDRDDGVTFSYEVTVPANTTVRARSGSGTTSVDGVQGPVDARAGSGAVRLTNLGGAVQASAGSGSVDIDTVTGDIDVRAGSGSIRITGARGGLSARTASGSITAQGQPDHEWRLQASSGSVTVRVPEQAKFDLYARTSSGHIDSRHPVTVMGTFGRRELVGKVRGGGFRLDIATSSGGIRIE